VIRGSRRPRRRDDTAALPPTASEFYHPPFHNAHAGFYTTNSTSVNGKTGFTCVPCGPDFWCPGAKGKATAASSKVRRACDQFTSTMGDKYAGKADDCKPLPGYGWAAGNGSYACPQGF
jgi:hypothetical protein